MTNCFNLLLLLLNNSYILVYIFVFVETTRENFIEYLNKYYGIFSINSEKTQLKGKNYFNT